MIGARLRMASLGRLYVGGLRHVQGRTLIVPMLFLVFIAALPSNTFVAIFLVRERGLDAAAVGLALTIHSLVRALVSPAMGALSDRYGRRVVLLACTISSAACAPGFLLIHDPLTLFAWLILFGLTTAAWFPVGISLLLDLTPVSHHQTVVALNTSALNVGYTVAIVATGFLVERGYVWLALWSVVLFLAVSIALLFTVPTVNPDGSGQSARVVVERTFLAFTDWPFLRLAGLSFAFPLSLGLLISVVPLYAAELGWSVSMIGLLLALNGVVVAVFSVPVNAPLERLGAFRSLPIACSLGTISELALLLGGPASLILCVVGLGLSEVVFAATLPTAISRLTPRGARGAYQGAWAMVSGLGFGIPLAVAGLTRETAGWQATWLLFGVVTLLATMGLARSVRPLGAIALSRSEAQPEH